MTEILGMCQIEGLRLFELNKHADARGSFLKNFSSTFLAQNHFCFEMKESFFNFSVGNVIRGMHLQTGQAAHDKLVTVLEGMVLDVVLDLRRNSPTFGVVDSFTLAARTPVLAMIPAGCAHGFCTLEDRNIVHYMTSSDHDPNFDTGIRYDSFQFPWPVKNPVISGRDVDLPSFIDFTAELGAPE